MTPFWTGILIGMWLGPCLIFIALGFYVLAFGERRKA